MRDFLYIGSAPHEEDCAQVGTPDYSRRALAECRRFMGQIERHYPAPEHSDCYLTIKREGHDFGSYYEVAAVFDCTDQAACDWAYDIEADRLGVLRTWEDIYA